MSILPPDHPGYGELLDRIDGEPISSCPRCGQTMIAVGDTICDPCRELEHEPQGEALTMFDMAPARRAPQPGGLF